MSVSPFCQIYSTSFIDTFQSSVSRFHYFRQRVLWCSSSIPLKYGFVNQTERENSVSVQAIKNASLSGIEILSSTASYGSGFSNGFWLDKWNKAQHPKLRKRTEAIVDYRNGGVSSEDDEETSNYSTMDRIVRKLKKFGYVDDRRDKDGEATETLIEKGSVEDIFYVEEGILPNSNGGFSEETPFGDKHGAEFVEKTRFPWEKPVEKETGGNSIIEKRSKTSLAELTLPESELRRLRHLAIRTKQKTKIGGAGVTQAVVDAIHEKWATSEVVRLKCEGAPALNMKRMHEILERKTGGLVIWRSGTSVSLYRGMSYESPSMQLLKKKNLDTHDSDIMSRAINDRDARHSIQHRTDGSPDTMRDEKESSESLPEINYEDEVDTLLEGLGPRFEDWPGPKPIPVDADLLPGVIPGYKPPFRILPYGVRAILGNREVTALRRLARVIPPHFALGRRREHQGLACAMVKLWEKSSIAKIAFKRGVQTTTSERMAEDIKKLTGSIILSRNKDYIVFYRGKDFLSAAVTEALLERERLAKALQDEEEQARLRACSSVVSNVEEADAPGSAGTLGETLEANSRWGRKMNEEDRSKVLKEAEVSRHAHLVRKLERKLFLAERKLGRAERALAKVEEFLKPSEYSTDRESLTDEERFMFRKLGLRMKAFLLLGRRGIFDGTIENMHLHWKYRELVKIIVKARNFDEVRHVALSLEAESGGVLVSVDKISKGFAVVVFRGRDYERPPTLRPKNLLTKRKALARSIELQRSEALRNHVSTLYKRAEKLRFELEQIESVKDEGDEILYSELDSSYPTDEETTEDELDEMYPEDCDSGKDEVCSENDVTNFSYIQNLGHESKDHLQELHRFGGRKKETEEENLME